MTLIDRARRYLDKLPPAISGSNGHAATFTAAVGLVHGFALSEVDAWPLLQEFNGRCSPPWSERELRHKLTSAVNTPHDKPRGHLAGPQNAPGRASSRSRTVQTYSPQQMPETPKSSKAIYDLGKLTELPDPIEDGARMLLRVAFEHGEGVRIAPATLSEDNREIPDGAGLCQSREKWLAKLDSVGGDPNAIWASSKRTGIYISLNPMKEGGKADADVTAFRHALIEFDEGLTPAEQFELYKQCGMPCTAVIYSGGKSVHAWVRVDAKDRSEYDARVKFIHDHFASGGYRMDEKNKNPSRFSRLPSCIRFDKRQELLATNLNCRESFSEWMIGLQAEAIGKHQTVPELLQFKPEGDENAILGHRWLCRGGSAILIGQSGIGKSSMAIQAFALWAMGRDFCGIKPQRPLKILVIQAENDEGDLAEMVQGVHEGLDIDPEPGAGSANELLARNLIFVRDTTHTGEAFTRAARRLIDHHKPDIVGLDPLLSFIGADISRQEVCSEFLRNWLNPIADATGCIWFMVHHMGKPSTDQKAKKHWHASDHAYSGMGSSELTNWARAIMVLENAGHGTFRLMLAKRGKRAGATHPDGEPSETVWLRHAERGIFWTQTPPPAPAEEKPKKAGRPESTWSMKEFVATLAGEELTRSQIKARACKFGDFSASHFEQKIWTPLKEHLTQNETKQWKTK